MKLLFSLVTVLLVGIHGQKLGRAKGKKEDVVPVEVEQEEVVLPLNSTAPFNETDKTQFSRRQWMEIAINQFFDDFEAGVTENAQYLFAQGAPYISNGFIYAGLDMSDPATWAAIPQKTRVDREFSVMNRTETWVRCIGVYPDGHSAMEFTSFTFDRKGMITTMSKLEPKECATPAVVATAPVIAPAGPITPASPPVVSPAVAPVVIAPVIVSPTGVVPVASPTGPQTRADSKRVPDVSTTTATSTITSTTPVAKSVDTRHSPTASPTPRMSTPGGKAKGKGKV
jgi:hypothetical protein